MTSLQESKIWEAILAIKADCNTNSRIYLEAEKIAKILEEIRDNK